MRPVPAAGPRHVVGGWVRGIRARHAAWSRARDGEAFARLIATDAPADIHSRGLLIAMVVHGSVSVPPSRWGAVENVVAELSSRLSRRGKDVHVEAGCSRAVRHSVADLRPDVIHLHQDSYSPEWVPLGRALKVPVVLTSHYGYLATDDRWDHDFRAILPSMLKAPAHFALSPEIAQVLRSLGYQGQIEVVPNGVATDTIRFSSVAGNGRAICLGKVEPRKQQASLSRELERAGVVCDFVGPIADPAFDRDLTTCSYLGEWTRQQVAERLTEYSALVLLSDGEAHPLVVMEAFAAGLSVVVTPQATANLDLSEPFIYVTEYPGPDVPALVRRACEANAPLRARIREYAQTEHDWERRVDQYERALSRVVGR